jgi:Trk-type K+ transport system membrane component
MDDRPEWLPEPIPKTMRPMRQRIFLGVISFISLLFGILGLVLVAYTVQCAWLVVYSPNRPLAMKLAIFTSCSAVATLALAVALRVVIHRKRRLHQ